MQATALDALVKTSFHACMYGSRRRKSTAFLASAGLFEHMLQCDGLHSHDEWGIHVTARGLQFATAAEAAYPLQLCQHMAASVVQHLPQPPPPPLPSLPRGVPTRPRPLLPEFSHVLFESSPPSDHSRALLTTSGDTTVSRDVQRHDAASQSTRGVTEDDRTPSQSSTNSRDVFKVGVRWKPEDFLHKAKCVEHPLEPDLVLTQDLQKAVERVLTMDSVSLAKSRLQAVITIKQMADDLAPLEKDFKNSLNPEVAQCLASKNLLLWKSLLIASGYDDVAIVDLVAQGVPLVGNHGSVPCMPATTKLATQTSEGLKASARLSRETLVAATKALKPQAEKDLMAASLEEVERGDLSGPFTEEQISQHFGHREWTLNPRFPVYQGDPAKLRVIDDCKASGLNAAFSPSYRVQLMDGDVLCCLVGTLAKALSRGSIHGSPLSDAASTGPWVGGTLDLKRAYKQIAIHPSSRDACVLGLLSADGWAYFRCRVLPFGATASVYSFMRVSRSLHHILVTYLNALCTVFFDDFPMLEPSQGASVLKSAVSAVLNCLGFWRDTEGKKQLKFDSSFIALGALIDLRDLASGEFVVSNKPGRVDKLIGLLRQARQEGRIPPEVASVIQGHLTFASGFYLSKTLRFLTKEISKASRLRAGGAQLASLCELAEAMLRSTPPRRVAMRHWQEPILLFSDGALEDGIPSAGTLMFDPITARCEAVAFETPCELVDVWSLATAGHYICQLEAWAVLCARKQWGDLIRGAPCIHWVDNDGPLLKAHPTRLPWRALPASTRRLNSCSLVSLGSSAWLHSPTRLMRRRDIRCSKPLTCLVHRL